MENNEIRARVGNVYVGIVKDIHNNRELVRRNCSVCRQCGGCTTINSTKCWETLRSLIKKGIYEILT